MSIESLTIPFVLKGTTEREISERMEDQISGIIQSIDITPDTYQGKECCTVVIKYKKHTAKSLEGRYCPSREEWTKSRNFP